MCRGRNGISIILAKEEKKKRKEKDLISTKF
jgi:hypothetical protein